MNARGRVVTLLAALVLLVVSSLSPSVARAQMGADVSIEAQVSPNPAVSGGQITTVFTIYNNGPGPAMSAQFTASTPTGTTFVAVTAEGGEVFERPQPGGTGFIGINFFELAPEASQTVTLRLHVTAAAGVTLQVRGSASSSDYMGDPNESNNTVTVNVPVIAPASEADLSVVAEGSDTLAARSTQFRYYFDVENVATAARRMRRDSATNVNLTITLPEFLGFGDLLTTHGTFNAPPVGESGTVTVAIGPLEEGALAAIELDVSVKAGAGDSIVVTSAVQSDAADPNPANNSATVTTSVVDPNNAVLQWEAPDVPDEANPLPPPRRVVILPSDTAGALADGTERGAVLIGYTIYRSNLPNVQATPGNVFATFPSSQTSANVPVAPSGTFFGVAADYDAGQSALSNEASADVAAATITSVKVKPIKIVAKGANFSADVIVLLDGIPFTTPPVVKARNTKVVQRGTLLTGQTIGAYMAAHPKVIVSFRNSSGGIASYLYPE